MTPASGAPVSLGFLLWHATLRWQRMIAAALRPLGLSHVQFVLLAVLWWFATERGKHPSQRALAEQAGTDPMMTSQVLRTLEHKKLLVRQPDPRDARARRLALTRSGKRLAVKAIEVVESVDAEFFGEVADARGLGTMLVRLADLEGGQVPTMVSR